MMKLHAAVLIVLTFCAALWAVPTRAADTKAPDPDLPQPLDLNLAQQMLDSSPFSRALNLSESLKLTGIAYVQGKPVATLMDKTTKKSFLVSEEPNAQGWRLAGASASNDLRATQVKIMIGAEMVTIHYGDAQLAPSKVARFPTDAEAIRNDENGKPYVRGSAYLSETDRERYYKGWSREAHDKFRTIIRDSREKMFASSPDERAAFSKKVFDTIDAEDKARTGK